MSAGTDFDKSQAERVISWTLGTPQNVFTRGNEWQLPKGLFVFFFFFLSSICWRKFQASWLACRFYSVNQSLVCMEMIPQQANLEVQVPHMQRRQNECMEKNKNECSGKPQTQSWEFYTHTFFFFVVVWLCFLNPLPGRSARPSMPTGFLSCDIYFFSLPSLPFFFLFCFSVRHSSCAGTDGPRAAHLVVITLSTST